MTRVARGAVAPKPVRGVRPGRSGRPAPAGRRPGRLAVLAGLICVTSLMGLAEAGYGADLFTLMAQGKASYHAGDLTRAGEAFLQAAVLAPASAKPALWLGAVAVARGDRRAAEAWFREALRRHPSLSEESCAVQWLDLLGTLISRPRWHLRIPEEYATFVQAVNPALTAGQAQWLGSAVISAAARHGIDPRLLAAVVFIESRFNHASVSSTGARGFGQLMPATAAALGVNPRDPLQNLLGAAHLLQVNLAEFHALPLALAAYNAGGNAVRRWRGIPPYAETQWYVWAVLWVYDGLKG
jgi:soluble lytic murein transglycosylase-like protein